MVVKPVTMPLDISCAMDNLAAPIHITLKINKPVNKDKKIVKYK